MTQTTIARSVNSIDATVSTSARRTEPARPRRAVNIALWALQVVTAGVFVMAALPKLTADPMAVAGFTAMGLGEAGMYVIGALELAGAIALLIPRLAGLAGLSFVGLMIGATTLTVLMFGVELAAMPATVGVLAATIAWGRRRSTAELGTLVRRYTVQH